MIRMAALLLLIAELATAQTIGQKSTGNCSPNIVVKDRGTVVVNFIGSCGDFDPQILEKIRTTLEELGKQLIQDRRAIKQLNDLLKLSSLSFVEKLVELELRQIRMRWLSIYEAKPERWFQSVIADASLMQWGQFRPQAVTTLFEALIAEASVRDSVHYPKLLLALAAGSKHPEAFKAFNSLLRKGITWPGSDYADVGEAIRLFPEAQRKATFETILTSAEEGLFDPYVTFNSTIRLLQSDIRRLCPDLMLYVIFLNELEAVDSQWNGQMLWFSGRRSNPLKPSVKYEDWEPGHRGYVHNEKFSQNKLDPNRQIAFMRKLTQCRIAGLPLRVVVYTKNAETTFRDVFHLPVDFTYEEDETGLGADRVAWIDPASESVKRWIADNERLVSFIASLDYKAAKSLPERIRNKLARSEWVLSQDLF